MDAINLVAINSAILHSIKNLQCRFLTNSAINHAEKSLQKILNDKWHYQNCTLIDMLAQRMRSKENKLPEIKIKLYKKSGKTISCTNRCHRFYSQWYQQTIENEKNMKLLSGKSS